MALIYDLLQRQPQPKETHISSQGIALWICWEEELDSAVNQTLQDYGGMLITADRNQSLWFFFSEEVILALARLIVWGQFNPLAVGIQVFSARLILGAKRELVLSVEPALQHQEFLPPPNLQIYVHPKIVDATQNIPGISYGGAFMVSGMALVKWSTLEADPRMPYTSNAAWFSLLRPIGNPLDKKFQYGWRHMFEAIDDILQHNKFKFAIHENFLMLSLDNLQSLRVWTRELLQCIQTMKQHNTEEYWPCVCAIVDKKGMNFNNELPNKVGIKWNQLVPDSPYMSYRNGYLLGDGFALNDLHFSSSNATIDSWCTVGLGEIIVTEIKQIPLLIPSQLISGQGDGCFYCGARSHEAVLCPSRNMELASPELWNAFGEVSVQSIDEAFRAIDATLSKEGLQGYATVFAAGGSQKQVLEAALGINQPAQPRVIENIWLYGGYDIIRTREGFSTSKKKQGRGLRDDSVVWTLLDKFRSAGADDLAAFEKELHVAITRNSREARLQTLLGFVAVERGDLPRALSAWKEAEALSSASQHQAWLHYLQGRVHEVGGRYEEAQEAYAGSLRLTPYWADAEYRMLVCRVKMGFAAQVQQNIVQFVAQAPASFNRFLVDPEMDRGHSSILTSLFPLWEEAQNNSNHEQLEIARLRSEVNEWFPVEQPIARRMLERLEDLEKLTLVGNYMAYLKVSKIRPLIEHDIDSFIQREIDRIQERFKLYLSRLEQIRDEASWFPFSRILVEFNKEFNECAGHLNWAFSVNFRESKSFRQAQALAPSIRDLIISLEKRLRYLRLVRDTTLFLLVFFKTFFWLEVVALVLSLVGVPLIAFFGDRIGLGWLMDLIRGQQWPLQKVLLIFVTVICMGIAALRTTLVFDKKKSQLIVEAKEQRERMQQERLEKLKARRDKQAKEAARNAQ